MAIVILYKGAEYTIPDDKAFVIGEQVEDIALLSEVVKWNRDPHYHKMARCLGAMLRFAGCKTSDKDVHSELMASLYSSGENGFLGQALMGLVAVLTDGLPDVKGEASGKPNAS